MDGHTKTALATGSFLSLAFLTYISIVFDELYPKRIAMNLKDELAVEAAHEKRQTTKQTESSQWRRTR